METSVESHSLVLPPALAAEVEAVAAAERRPALDVLKDAVESYMTAKHIQLLPAYVQERARTLGLLEGGMTNRLVRKVSDMSAAELEAIGNIEMDACHNHLDAELE